LKKQNIKTFTQANHEKLLPISILKFLTEFFDFKPCHNVPVKIADTYPTCKMPISDFLLILFIPHLRASNVSSTSTLMMTYPCTLQERSSLPNLKLPTSALPSGPHGLPTYGRFPQDYRSPQNSCNLCSVLTSNHYFAVLSTQKWQAAKIFRK